MYMINNCYINIVQIEKEDYTGQHCLSGWLEMWVGTKKIFLERVENSIK